MSSGAYDLFDRQVPSEMRKHCNVALAQIAKRVSMVFHLYFDIYYRILLVGCSQEFIPMDSERLHLIEHPAGSFVLMAVLR